MFVLFGVAETKTSLRLKFIVRFIMFKSQFVLNSFTPEFVQTVSK